MKRTGYVIVRNNGRSDGFTFYWTRTKAEAKSLILRTNDFYSIRKASDEEYKSWSKVAKAVLELEAKS